MARSRKSFFIKAVLPLLVIAVTATVTLILAEVTTTVPADPPTVTTLSPTSGPFTVVPAVTSVTPTVGHTSGGTPVIINGTGFTGATRVEFGPGHAATNVNVVNDTRISADSPPWSPGPRTAVSVLVTTPGGTSDFGANVTFTYIPAPSVSTVSPKVGPTAGANTVTITGSHYVAPASASFGGVPASSVSVVTPNRITMMAPAGAPGVVDIVITTPYGTSTVVPADRYTYSDLPTIMSVSPSSGPTSGGNQVTITGTNFIGITSVQFGTTFVAGGNYTVDSPTQITVTNVPARPAGKISVYVTNPRGRSASTAGKAYAYV